MAYLAVLAKLNDPPGDFLPSSDAFDITLQNQRTDPLRHEPGRAVSMLPDGLVRHRPELPVRQIFLLFGRSSSCILRRPTVAEHGRGLYGARNQQQERTQAPPLDQDRGGDAEMPWRVG